MPIPVTQVPQLKQHFEQLPAVPKTELSVKDVIFHLAPELEALRKTGGYTYAKLQQELNAQGISITQATLEQYLRMARKGKRRMKASDRQLAVSPVPPIPETSDTSKPSAIASRSASEPTAIAATSNTSNLGAIANTSTAQPSRSAIVPAISSLPAPTEETEEPEPVVDYWTSDVKPPEMPSAEEI